MYDWYTANDHVVSQCFDIESVCWLQAGPEATMQPERGLSQSLTAGLEDRRSSCSQKVSFPIVTLLLMWSLSVMSNFYAKAKLKSDGVHYTWKVKEKYCQYFGGNGDISKCQGHHRVAVCFKRELTAQPSQIRFQFWSCCPTSPPPRDNLLPLKFLRH